MLNVCIQITWSYCGVYLKIKNKIEKENNVEKLEPLVEMQYYAATMETSMEGLQKIRELLQKIELLYDPTVLLLGIYIKKKN